MLESYFKFNSSGQFKTTVKITTQHIHYILTKEELAGKDDTNFSQVHDISHDEIKNMVFELLVTSPVIENIESIEKIPDQFTEGMIEDINSELEAEKKKLEEHVAQIQ